MCKISKPEKIKGLVENISNKYLGGLMLPTYVVYIVAAVVAVVAGLLGFLFAKNREKKNAEGIIAAAKQQEKNMTSQQTCI